jgi:hypothetical protein
LKVCGDVENNLKKVLPNLPKLRQTERGFHRYQRMKTPSRKRNIVSKYHPLEGNFKKAGFDLFGDGVKLRLSPPPRTIQPHHRSSYFLHEVDEVGSLNFISAVWDYFGELRFEIGRVWFALKLSGDSASIRQFTTPRRPIPFVCHRDFVALNATTKPFTTGFQLLKKVGK